MTAADFVPADQTHRDRICRSLEECLYVEAGAGTGKTTALVSRIISLIKAGRPVEGIAAITFTEAAAAELRERVRRELEAESQKTENDAEARGLLDNALRSLEGASLQTLHSFAGSLLRERPLEAGLPPGFEVVESIEADLNFEKRWQPWLDQAMEDANLGPAILQAVTFGLRLEYLREVARSFHENYDLLEGCQFPLEDFPVCQAPYRLVELTEDIHRLLPLSRNGPDDLLYAHAERVASLGNQIRALGCDSEEALLALARFGQLTIGKGKQADWGRDSLSGENACKLLKGICQELQEQRDDELKSMLRTIFMPLLAALRQFVLDYAKERRSQGKAEFHDLLVWARNMLRDHLEARRYFQSRFTNLLIDEFQDTDPIQAEIAFFLSEAPTKAPATDWNDVTISPGKLFVVGDPKQSIYRFRRADIAALATVQKGMEADSVPLSQNFRSQETVIAWVNQVFNQWMGGGVENLQAPYVDLVAGHTPPQCEPPLGVHLLGCKLDLPAEEARREEAGALTALLQDIRFRPWQVRGESGVGLRAARYQDICLLLPTRTSLPALERALEEASIPYRVESQSLVLGTQDVKELLACLRAIDSPADQVALVAALRSPAFGCNDVELLQFVENGGKFDCTDPGTTEGPIAEALAALRQYHQKRTWMAPDQLIEQFIREQQMVEACFNRSRPRERWRRLRFVVERARAFAQVGGRSFRAFLDWIERQAEEGARAVEAAVPETDDDAVRIMTIHAAKGLEFPILVLSGLGAPRRHQTAPVIWDRYQGRAEVRVGPSNGPRFSTAGYEEAEALENDADEAESVRLMYVATTRAKDHLVVSLYRGKRSSGCPAETIEGLCAEVPHLWRTVELSGVWSNPIPEAPAEAITIDTAEDRGVWLEKRYAILQKASRPAAIGVTALARDGKEEEERGEIAYRRGRAGTSIGRAVHSVLQTIDLATGSGLEEVSRAQAAVESIPERWREVAHLAKVALEADVVRRAVASQRYYREVFVGMPLDGWLLEGFIDLLFETPEGYVIIDYKTDRLDKEEGLEASRQRYSFQAGAYALAVYEALGRPVSEVVLLFLHACREMAFADLDELMAGAKQRAEAAMAAV